MKLVVVRLDQTVNEKLASVKVMLTRVMVRTADEDAAAGWYYTLNSLQPTHWKGRCRSACRVAQAVHVGHATVLACCVKVVERA